MDVLNPTPTLRPSAEKILLETERGRRTDSPDPNMFDNISIGLP